MNEHVPQTITMTPASLVRPAVVDLASACQVADVLRARMRAAVLGREEIIQLILIALIADGHVLLEDYPGSGKTTLAKAIGAAIIDDRPDDYIVDFRRIQFTPDLLPSDVTGSTVFDVTSSRFHFRHGPLFAHVVLADEINRTSPKVQSAMLEAMAEKQVTVDNVTYPLDDLFFVIATQNPLDVAGTYPLPSPQLDRFLFKIRMHHIDRAAELAVLKLHQRQRSVESTELPRVTRTQVFEARTVIGERVALSDAVSECLLDIARATRQDERVMQGASTRSLVLALPALKSRAALCNRDFVSSEDIEALVVPLLAHRIELAPGLTNPAEILRELSTEPLERLARSTMRSH
jgi:MoxR-like ATPase